MLVVLLFFWQAQNWELTRPKRETLRIPRFFWPKYMWQHQLSRKLQSLWRYHFHGSHLSRKPFNSKVLVCSCSGFPLLWSRPPICQFGKSCLRVECKCWPTPSACETDDQISCISVAIAKCKGYLIFDCWANFTLFNTLLKVHLYTGFTDTPPLRFKGPLVNALQAPYTFWGYRGSLYIEIHGTYSSARPTCCAVLPKHAVLLICPSIHSTQTASNSAPRHSPANVPRLRLLQLRQRRLGNARPVVRGPSCGVWECRNRLQRPRCAQFQKTNW